MKKIIIICIACSNITCTLASPVCSSVKVPDSCQNCSIKHAHKDRCEVKCASCRRTDDKRGLETKISFKHTEIAHTKIVNCDGKLGLVEITKA